MSFLCSNIFHDLVFDFEHFSSSFARRSCLKEKKNSSCVDDVLKNKQHNGTNEKQIYFKFICWDVFLSLGIFLFMFQQSERRKEQQEDERVNALSRKEKKTTTSRQNKFMRPEEIN